MTLIVGIKPPFFGPTENAGRGLIASGLGLRPGTILATDSRWTVYQNRDSPGESFDVATKLFRIASNTAICYAGNSSIAESCVELLLQKKAQGKIGSLEQIAGEFGQLWASNPESQNHANGRLVLLLGHLNRQNTAELWLVDSVTHFKLEQIDSGWFEGPDTASIEFERYLYKTVDDALNGRNGGGLDLLNPRDWEILIAQAFDNAVLDSHIDRTVGGALQICCIDQDGFHTPSIKRIDFAKSDLPQVKQIVQVSVSEADLQKWGTFKRTLM